MNELGFQKMKALRLLLARIGVIYRPIGEWEIMPYMVRNEVMKRRLRADGSFEFSPMSIDEQAEYVSIEAW